MKRKKIFFFLLLLFILGGFKITKIKGQEQASLFNFQRAYADYLYNLEQYQKAHQEYLTAKEAYRVYQTLNTKNKSLKKGVKVLIARDEVLRTYLLMLQMRLKETPGEENIKREIEKKTQIWQKWLQERRKRLEAISNFDDFNRLSQELEEKYPEIEKISYQGKGIFLLAKLEKETEAIHSLLQEVTSLSQNQNKDFSLVKEKIKLAQEKHQQSLALLLEESSSETKRLKKIWPKIRTNIIEEKRYLQEALIFLEELTS